MSTPANDEGESGSEEIAALADGRRIRGHVDAGYGPVADAFVANFEKRGDLGAACTVRIDGRVAVDLWGGVANRRAGTAWTPQTCAVIFSCSKGILAICAYRLVDQGRLDLDLPIARWWPEFASAGKSEITVRDAMSHRAGLAWLDTRLNRAEALAWYPVIEAIERQVPSHPPTAGHAYHPLTYGWILGEVIRRLTGLMPGAFFRKEIGDRLGLAAWIGLPEHARGTVAWMEPPLPDEDSDAARLAVRLAASDPTIEPSFTLGQAWGFPVEEGVVSFNDPAIQAAQVPGANGISTARSLALLYAACVAGEDVGALLTRPALEDALRVRAEGPQLTGMPDDGSRWGTGFQLSSPPSQPMLGAASFGHAGAGGQLAFGDLEHRVGFAYLTNQMGGYGDARARALTTALGRAIAA